MAEPNEHDNGSARAHSDPLLRAMELCREFEGKPGTDATAFLAEHEDLRDLLEPLLDPGDSDSDDVSLRIGDYELVREIGRGGMGVVYEAIQTRLGRTVALKLLSPHRALAPRALAMFRREATLAASLDHPGIARVLELEESDGQLALAMELCDGMPLDAVLDALGGRAPGTLTAADLLQAAEIAPDDAPALTGSYSGAVVELGRQVAEALAHAHARGVVHRDVKPGNIMLSGDGTAVLTDFGLAREDGTAGITRTGEFAGTYQYAAPEQIEGRIDAIDGRTDVYALGATLYEMLTLARPLDADSLSEFFRVLRTEDPAPPSRRNPRVSRDLDAVVLRALEKDPAARYASARELAEDLARVQSGQPVLARRLSAPRRTARWMRRNPLATGLVATLCVATATVSAFAYSAHRSALAAAASDQKSTRTLQRFDNLWVGAALDAVEQRAERAHPAWPAQAAELHALVRQCEDELLPMRDAHERVLAELRSGHLGAASTPRPAHRAAHPAVPRIHALEGEIHRIEIESKGRINAAARREAAQDLLVLRREVEALRALVAASDPVQIPNRRDADLHDRLEQQLFRLRDVAATLLPDLRFRLDWARQIHAHSIEQARGAWDAAIARLQRDPRFKKPIAPQLGLVPLGADPTTKLEEFAHLMSGTPPVRGADGKLTYAPDSGIVFVLLPGTELRYRELTLRLDPFFIGKHELGRGQWRHLARGLPGLRWRDGGIADVRNRGELDKPVNGVSWHQCDALLHRCGLTLPTAAQWEYAATFGRGVPEGKALARQANLRDQTYARGARRRGQSPEGILPFEDGFAGLAPTHSMAPNDAGLHHVFGNLCEWCRDAHLGMALLPRQGDGFRDIDTGRNGPRIVMGGHWLGDRPTLLDRRAPMMSARDTGLRPVRPVLP
ncbi:MAG: protein kinase [Planctomycetes bacterium]|nr:protein kinase [Planctomycetota bacterium]